MSMWLNEMDEQFRKEWQEALVTLGRIDERVESLQKSEERQDKELEELRKGQNQLWIRVGAIAVVVFGGSELLHWIG